MESHLASPRVYNRLIVLLILVAAAAMRLIHLGSMSLSNDELSALSRLHFDSFDELIRHGVYVDAHPAGLHVFLYYWIKIFGDSPFALRFPFAACGILTVFFIHRLGRNWFNELTAQLAASSFAVLAFTVLFTQFARMYSPGILFSVLTVYCWTHVLFDVDNKKRYLWYAGWILSMSICMHLHYISFLFVALVGLSGFFFITRRNIWKYVAGALIAMILFLPEINIFRIQLGRGGLGGWLPPPSKYFLAEFFFDLFNRSRFLCILICILFVIGISTSRKMIGVNRWRILSLSWFLLVFGICYVYSLTIAPIIMYSTMLFTVPFLLLFIFSYTPSFISQGKNAAIFSVLFLLFLLYDTVIAGKYFTTYYFGVFKEIARDIKSWNDRYGRENSPAVINVVNPEYLTYYFDRIAAKPDVKMYNVYGKENLGDLIELVRTSPTEYFIYAWTNTSHPFEIPEIIRQSYPFLIEQNIYFNSATYLFSKQADRAAIDNLLFETQNDFESSQWTFQFANANQEQFHSPSHSEKLISEFSTGFRQNVSEIPGEGVRNLIFSAWVYVPPDVLDAGDCKIVYSLEREKEIISYSANDLREFDLEPGKWSYVLIAGEIPRTALPKDQVKVFIWNRDSKTLYIDDMKVRVYQGREEYKLPIH